MSNSKKYKISKKIFNEILSCRLSSELEEIFKKNNLHISYTSNVVKNEIESIIFDDTYVFDFLQLELVSLIFSIQISGNHFFDKILISNNNNQNFYTRIIFDNVDSKEIEITKNSNIDLEIENSTYNEFNFSENKNIRRICLINTEVKEEFEVKDSDVIYFYIENSKLYNLSIDNMHIDFEGIVVKDTTLNNLVISTCPKIYTINFSKNCRLNSLSITDSSINYINIDNSEINYIHANILRDIHEFTIYDNSKINSLSFYLSSINRFLISDETTIKDIIFQKDTNVNQLRLTDNSSIHSITIKESNVLSLIFYRGTKVNYFESDEKSKLGDFDILDSYFKSLILSNQSNSYNFRNTEIGLLDLNKCKISSLNLLNGCKIEAYVSNSEIDKIEFKKVTIVKDTSLSFNSCKVYSIVMEGFSVMGNLFFRNLVAMEKPLDEEWSNLNKYFAKPNATSDDNTQQLYSTRSKILDIIKNKEKKWLYELNYERDNLKKDLVEKNYINSKINFVDLEQIIENIKFAHLLDKEYFEKFLYEEIKNYTFKKLKKLKDFMECERENLNFNFNILQFIWAVISKMKTYDLGFQNIDKPIFRVYQSSLGKTEFSNCALRDFEFQYNTTNFYDCIFLGTEIPEDNLKILDNEIKVIDSEKIDNFSKIDFYLQRSDFYNQFKKIFEKQGNIFNAGLYNSKWSQNQEKLLLLKIKKEENYLQTKYDIESFFKSLFLFFEKKNIETKQNIFTFNLNRISNKHGESWIKSLYFIIIPLSILFLFYIISIYYDCITLKEICDKNIKFTFDNEFCSIILYHMKDFPIFLNPTRKIDFFQPIIGKGSVDFTGNLIDFFSRIVLAFGIYQLIVAFRKNAKKQ